MTTPQNNFKRTVISFGIAVFLAILTLFIQDWDKGSLSNQPLEAAVAPIKAFNSQK